MKSRNSSGGGGGIRTPETLSSLTVFKTAGFNRSPTPPLLILTYSASKQQSRDNWLALDSARLAVIKSRLSSNCTDVLSDWVHTRELRPYNPLPFLSHPNC